jgi:DNA-binding NtrC family response regulator
MSDKLLIIDDNTEFLKDVGALFNGRYNILTATDARTGMDILRNQRVSAVLLDLNLPDMFGIDVLKRIQTEIDPYIPVIIVTEYDDSEKIVTAMRLGAYDFIPKHFNLDVLSAKISKALERRALHLGINALQEEYLEQQGRFVFSSETMKKVSFEMTRLAQLDVDVILYGETGVGKDLIASQIHVRGNRRDKPFIPVSIRSLSDTLIESELFGHEKGAFSGATRSKVGKFEAANKGTIYIPEISTLSEAVQLKLLHFMQYKSITRVGQDPTKSDIRLDVRLIMATNENLVDLVRQGKIREDFYHRITGVSLKIPPLRERKKDIKPLVDYYINAYADLHPSGTCEIDSTVLDAFYEYRWPGNVRELANALKNAIVYAKDPVLTLRDFPNIVNEPVGKQISGGGLSDFASENHTTLHEANLRLKKIYFTRLLNEYGNDINKIAHIAGITPQATRRILKDLDLRK